MNLVVKKYDFHEQSANARANRIEWVDFFKAIAIIFVVIGHATGKFNQYIYQFHMPAFFFISGYCLSWNGVAKKRIIWNKIYSLMFPLFSIFVLGALFMAVLYRTGIYQIFWRELDYIGFPNTVKLFLSNGDNYVWWMGATWFVQVLLWINIIWVSLLFIVNNLSINNKYVQTIIMLFLSVVLFFVGILLSRMGISRYDIDLAFLGQIFFGYGICVRNLHFKEEKAGETTSFIMALLWSAFCTVSIIVMMRFSIVSGSTMDFPSRDFKRPALNLILGANGILFVYSLSRLLDMLTKKIFKLRQGIIFLGQNTMAVMFFHFLMFKVVFVLLYFMGKLPYENLSDTTPTGDIGWTYLPAFLLISFAGSILIWKGISLLAVGKVLLGEDKSFREKIWNAISSIFFCKGSIDSKWKVLVILIVPAISLGLEELICNNAIGTIIPIGIIVGYLVYFVINSSLMFILCNVQIASIITLIVAWMFGVAEHFVFVFRGNPLRASDFLVVGTAKEVAGQYNYEINLQLLYGTFIMVAAIMIIIYIPFVKSRIIKWKRIALFFIGITEIFLATIFINSYDIADEWNLWLNTWNPSLSFYEYGSPLAFLLSYQGLKLTSPEGYNKQMVEESLLKYDDDSRANQSEMPSVIVIMNESFSDLKVLGDFESDGYLDYFNSIDDYTMRGYTYCSIDGAGTGDSEFEFLTGVSMAGFDAYCYPYMSYDMGATYSYVKKIREQGLDTIAFHPYLRSNYNRINVYEQLGFNSFWGDEAVKEFESVTWGCSDRADYKTIIDYDSTTQEPYFLFNVTMQNHGGYAGFDNINAEHKVKIYNESDRKKYESAETYLTLMKESDLAFKFLLDYYRDSDKKVIIVLFGDHQPNLEDTFVEDISEEGNSIEIQRKHYMTPYIIWSNYDMGEEKQEVDMSINYLGANLMNLMGIRTSYSEYLLDMQKELPVITAFGYKDSEGDWHNIDEKNDKINEYLCVQFYEFTENK